MPSVGSGRSRGLENDGREWRIGTDADVAWIRSATAPGLTISSALPVIFAAYATVIVPDKDMGRGQDAHLLFELLRQRSPAQPWWLGYLDTGADDLVFLDARKVTLYTGWRYVFVLAGPDEAASWRQDEFDSWRAPGPDIAFPQDREWADFLAVG